ncbi:hypothetical protein BDN70DRAFT_935166 [Pholiota conissans]|uniref:HNH nuclease domain-containing protein n=1 Tax=Pholiota conissans TaxID=109636 RepID=A0A9P6CX64_9AGAR|nr:hypothetical protein BDN70DRAFT_935166 [Pholiota conissans]
MMQSAEFYANTFIRAFKRPRCTSASIERPSRFSFEDDQTYCRELPESQLDHRTARYQISSLESAGEAYTSAAHIIPESTNTNISGGNEGGAKHQQSSEVWAILSMFGKSEMPLELQGNKIHRLKNIITMCIDYHLWFDDLCFWFKPVKNEPNAYTTHVGRPSSGRLIPETITFNTMIGYPPPSKEYLALHALCFEVAWMSGAVEYIADIQRKMEETNILANDGSSATLLANILLPLTVR